MDERVDMIDTVVVLALNADSEPNRFLEEVTGRVWCLIYDGTARENIKLLIDSDSLEQLYSMWACQYLVGPVLPTTITLWSRLRMTMGKFRRWIRGQNEEHAEAVARMQTVKTEAVMNLWEEMVSRQAIIVDGWWYPLLITGDKPELEWRGVQCSPCTQVQ